MTLADDHSNCQKFFLAHNEAEAEAKMLYYVVSYVTNNRVSSFAVRIVHERLKTLCNIPPSMMLYNGLGSI